MATIGLSKPYYAIYDWDGSAETEPTYKEGGLLGKYTDLTISLDEGSDNVLYADNAPAESDNQFSGGSASITTDDLRPESLTPVWGVKSEAMPTNTTVTADAKWYVFDDDQNVPYLGLGGVIKKKVGGAYKWVAFILTKVQLSNPGIVATTQGETISWQTQALNAKILRADDAKHRWFMVSSSLDTEADAEAAVKAYLKIA